MICAHLCPRLRNFRTLFFTFRPLTETSANMAFEKLHLKKINQNSKNMSMHNEPKEKICLGKEYDLFISYSHKDTKIANMIFKYITKIKPHWNIFFDAETLKAGVAWQAKLYTSIGTVTYLCKVSSFRTF